MNRIDDNILAAFLEGSLPDEEREWVEQAVEEDDELKVVVDEWISMADNLYAATKPEMGDDRELRMEACRSIGTVMEQVKRESRRHEVAACAAMPEQEERRACAAKPARISSLKQKWPTYRKILVAASVLAFVSAAGIWLLRSPDDTIRSAPSFDMPMSGNYKTCEPGFDSTFVDTSLQFQDFSELYK